MAFKNYEPRPLEFPQVNKRYVPPRQMESKAGTLPCYVDGNYAISLWKFPWWQRVRFLFSGKMWFLVMSRSGHPPISLSVAPMKEYLPPAPKKS